MSAGGDTLANALYLCIIMYDTSAAKPNKSTELYSDKYRLGLGQENLAEKSG